MPTIKNLAAAPAMIAALSLAATPAAAAELPQIRQAPTFAVPTLDQAIEDAQTAEKHRHRRYHRYRHHRRGPGLGDVIAGVLIVGAIAHVANSASRNDRRDRDRDRDYRRDVRWDDGRGIDRAVGMCIDAVERDVRVETVDRVDRTARGWQVAGTVYNGDGFTCRIGENGRIEDIDYGRGGARYDDDDRNDDDDRYEDIDYRSDSDVDDRQWDDDRYASEWTRVDQGAAQRTDQPAAAYPGGPVEGGEIDADLDVGTGYPGAGT